MPSLSGWDTASYRQNRLLLMSNFCSCAHDEICDTKHSDLVDLKAHAPLWLSITRFEILALRYSDEIEISSVLDRDSQDFSCDLG